LDFVEDTIAYVYNKACSKDNTDAPPISDDLTTSNTEEIGREHINTSIEYSSSSRHNFTPTAYPQNRLEGQAEIVTKHLSETQQLLEERNMISPPIDHSFEGESTSLRGKFIETQSDLAHNIHDDLSDRWHKESKRQFPANSRTVKDNRSPLMDNGNLVMPFDSTSMKTSLSIRLDEKCRAELPSRQPQTRQVTPQLIKPNNRSRNSTTQCIKDSSSLRTRSKTSRPTRRREKIHDLSPVNALKQKRSRNKSSKLALTIHGKAQPH